MADTAVVHIGENSPEKVAYKLLVGVLDNVSDKTGWNLTRQQYLDAYAECLYTVKNPHMRARQ